MPITYQGGPPKPLARRDKRHKRGWSQAELGRRVGLPQMHVSSIETGKIAPRFDTLLDLVRVLDRDLLMVPRSLRFEWRDAANAGRGGSSTYRNILGPACFEE